MTLRSSVPNGTQNGKYILKVYRERPLLQQVKHGRYCAQFTKLTLTNNILQELPTEFNENSTQF
jgi:hypothetical protein